MSKQTQDRSDAGRPLVTGIVIGVLLGVAAAVAVAVWLNVRGTPFAERQAPAVLPPMAPADSSVPETGSTDAEPPRFDFYEILPGNEPAMEEAPRSATGAPLWLQAGAFRSASDADDRKARIALLGQNATVQRIEVDGGFVHRIRVGPFTSEQELEAVRAFLSDNGIDSIPVRPDEP